jgi:arylsulfatase A-like enzyme
MKYDRVGFRAGGSLKVYAEMMKNLDAGIGRVLDALKTSGLERKTLVIFTSDNGGERFSFNWPFSGQKGDLREGGVRVPAIVRWPGVVRPGTITDQPVVTMDWTATMVAAAGSRSDPHYPFDGIDLTSALAGRSNDADRSFFWRTKRQGAMRRGKWKFLREDKNEVLFDLSVDEREQAEFKSENIAVFEGMRREFDKWESEMMRYPAVSG